MKQLANDYDGRVYDDIVCLGVCNVCGISTAYRYADLSEQ